MKHGLITFLTAFAVLISLVAMNSCAPQSTPPRAFVPPKSEISKIDTGNVAASSKSTTTAVEKVSHSLDDSASAALRLDDDAKRLNKAVAEAKKATAETYQASLDAIGNIAADLATKVEELKRSLKAAQAARDAARQAVNEHESELQKLVSAVAKQDAEIKAAKDNEELMRGQLEDSNKARDMLIAEQAKHQETKKRAIWWRLAAWITWGVIGSIIAWKIFASIQTPFKL
jgi:chromosome segregation ATPase